MAVTMVREVSEKFFGCTVYDEIAVLFPVPGSTVCQN